MNFDYEALSCFGRALLLLQESLDLSTIGSKSVINRVKKKPFWSSYCLFTEETLLSLREPLIICLPIPFGLQSSLQYHLLYPTAVALAHPSIMKTPRIDYYPPPSDTYSRAGRSVSSFIKRMALECMPYYPNAMPSTLFFFGRPIASSFTAENHSLEHGLVWCNNHKTTCHFQ